MFRKCATKTTVTGCSQHGVNEMFKFLKGNALLSLTWCNLSMSNQLICWKKNVGNDLTLLQCCINVPEHVNVF